MADIEARIERLLDELEKAETGREIERIELKLKVLRKQS